MVSEVRKVLEREHEVWGEYSFYKEIANAERSDAARREEPVQALRQAVAELAAKWMERSMPLLTAGTVRELLDELNAIIATRPDAVENRPATASGPLHDITPAGEPKECDRQYATATGQTHDLTPVHPIIVQQMREIAAKAVRDAMPDVLDGMAETFGEKGFAAIVNAFREHAAKLRKEQSTGHSAAVAAVSDAIGKACDEESRQAPRHQGTTNSK